jgi:hypothetical protein
MIKEKAPSFKSCCVAEALENVPVWPTGEVSREGREDNPTERSDWL